MNRILVLCLLLLSVLAGCTDNEADSGPRFGLGLDTNNPPPPGPFRENETDLARLEDFIESWGPGGLRKCGTENTNGLNFYLAGRFYLEALTTVFDVCLDGGNDIEQAWQDHDAGVIADRIPEIQREQRAILDSLISEVAGVPVPNNQVDAQVLAWLMRRLDWQHAAFGLGTDLAEKYLANPDRELAPDVYLNLHNPQQEAPIIRDFLAKYPWTSEVCVTDPVEIERFFEEATLEMNASARRAYEMDPANASRDRAVWDYEPGLAFMRENGWWVGAKYYVMQEAYSDSYWDHWNDPVLPSLQEATFLYDSYLNRSRTLTTDELYNRVLQTLVFQDQESFERYREFPVNAVALGELPWTYADLPCR